ncbi:MAG: hypothetical protein IIX86_10105, partial [Clostridia bacterium]|nr:hypothetical protein [Clostridia bacterium]
MSKKSILRLITAIMAIVMLSTVCSICVFAEQAPESESIALADQEPEQDIGNIASFGDESVWSFLIQIFILILALLVGNILRRKIPFIRRSLIPTSLLGGLLILLIKLLPFYDNVVNQATMEIITSHALGIGFIALGLKQAKDSQKTSAGKVMETGILTAA